MRIQRRALRAGQVLATMVAAAGLTARAADPPPNIVIMLADDLGWADVGYHGGNRVETPHIDRLAAEGLELDRFYVAPMCSPTRAGLMTGRYPIRFGMARAVIPPYRNFGLPPEERTMAEALGEAGYAQRGVFGKWHLGHHQAKWHPLAQGFTHFEGHYNGAIDYFTQERDGERDWHINYEPVDKEGYATDLVAAAAVAFIRQAAAADAPYFCYIPFNAPHTPLQARPDVLARYTDRKKPSREDILRAMIWSLDEGVGRVLQAIEDSGEAERTQVWFLSDNGGIGGVKDNNLPLRGNKLTTYEGGVRVVACVRWPAAWKGGRRIEHTMGYLDVLPTVLASAGIDPGAGQAPERPLDGISLVALLAGDQTGFPERDWYSYHGQGGPKQETIAIKTARWKMIVQGPDLREHGITNQHKVQLFAMPDDLLEKNDVSRKHPKVITSLTRKLTAYRTLQPEQNVRPYTAGRQGYTPPKDWRIAAPGRSKE